MDLSIVIVNHNTKKLTEQTIQSVFDTTKNISYEIIVADNSTDPSQVLDMKDDRVKILKNLENKGFGNACNIGTKVAIGKSSMEFSLSATLSSGDAIVQLLLLDGVQTFATVVKGPVGINAITAVVRGLTATAGDVVATDDGTAFTVRAVHNALADTCREAGKKSSLGCFYIYFCAFRTDTVTLQGDVVLQGIVDAKSANPTEREVQCQEITIRN